MPRESFVTLDLIVQHILSQLEKRETTVRSALASAHQGQPLPKTLSMMESMPQVSSMHTIIRNKETNQYEFIFYSNRLMRMEKFSELNSEQNHNDYCQVYVFMARDSLRKLWQHL